MADVSMSYTAVENLADEVSQMQTQLEEILDSLDALVNSKTGKWKGRAHQKFVSSYQSLEPKLRDICKGLGGYASEIRKAASDQANTDKTSAKNFTSVDSNGGGGTGGIRF